MKIALQLYSVREQIAALGFETVLAKVKQAGFDGVEFAGYHELGVSGAANAIKKHGLLAMGAHIGLNDMQGQQFLQDIKELGLQSAAIPAIGLQDLQNDFANVVQKLSNALDNCRCMDIPLYYHNHAFELEGGEDYLIRLTDALPGLLLEADIFWIKAAGLEPYDYFIKNRSRIGVLHIKELNAEGVEYPNPIVGDGISDSERLIKLAKQAGHGWAVLEAENVGTDMFGYLAECCRVMQKFAKDI